MDPNTQQLQQPVIPQPIRQQVPQHVTKSSSLSKILLSVLGVVVVLGLIGGAYYLGTQKSLTAVSHERVAEKTIVVSPTQTPTTMPNAETVSVDNNNNKYINHAVGFSITYPKVSGNPNCENGNLEASPLTTLEDLSNNSVYLTFSTQSYQMHTKLPDGTYSSGGPGFNCKTLSVTVSDIKNGVDNGFQNNAWFHPINYHFQYAQITNDNDLLTLGENGLQVTGCIGVKKTLVGNNVYSVTLNSSSSPQSACILNFGYKFLYNQAKHLAIVWGTGQQPTWQLGGKVYDVTVDFLNN